MVFDRENAFLRHVRFGDSEVLRGIFAAIRDQDWDTIPFSVHDFELEQSADSFSLQFLACCQHNTIQFDWKGKVSGTRDGVVRYRFDGKALSSFRKNRIGLCVLHPIRECAGQPCKVEHTDGSIVSSKFPQQISPHQPFKNLRSITHKVHSGINVKVGLHGEVFEMEDQRNWTDASYKTYSTPLELPFPVEIVSGSSVVHEVSVELLSEGTSTISTDERSAGDETPTITINFDQSRPRAKIGFGFATSNRLLPAEGIAKLAGLRPDHLRIDLKLDAAGWKPRGQQAIEMAQQIGSQLEVALFATSTSDSAWQDCLKLFGDQPDLIARLLVFHPDAKATPSSLGNAALESLARWNDSIPVVVGTDAYFAELNRNRPQVNLPSQVCYSINPQVHAFDNLSLAETLEAQRWTVDSAHAFLSCPVVVSPVTLRPRFNPNATSVESNASQVPESDARQSTGFAAAWTVGAVSQLATHPNVSSVTFYETHGPPGVMDEGGNLFPVATVFEAVGASEQVAEASCSHPLELTAVGLTMPNGSRSVLVGNMSGQPRRVKVDFTQAGKRNQISIDIDAESVRFVPLETRS